MPRLALFDSDDEGGEQCQQTVADPSARTPSKLSLDDLDVASEQCVLDDMPPDTPGAKPNDQSGLFSPTHPSPSPRSLSPQQAVKNTGGSPETLTSPPPKLPNELAQTPAKRQKTRGTSVSSPLSVLGCGWWRDVLTKVSMD